MRSPWRESLQQKDDKLADQGAARNFGYDRNFPGGRKTGDVFGRDGRIVDDDAGGLSSGLGGMGRKIVDLGGRKLGDGGDVVQKCERATHLNWSLANWSLAD